jgi:hypothetical protein
MIDPYSTHQRLLIRWALKTSGAIAETGCGYYSTPILAEIAKAKGVNLHSYIQDEQWAERFNCGRSPYHQFYDCDFSKPIGLRQQYGMILLDHEQLVRERIKHVPSLLEKCDVVVVHDAQVIPNLGHRFAVLDYDATIAPHTAVLGKAFKSA